MTRLRSVPACRSPAGSGASVGRPPKGSRSGGASRRRCGARDRRRRQRSRPPRRGADAGRGSVGPAPWAVLDAADARGRTRTGEIDAVLWNHGGAGDDVQGAWPGRIVSVLAPTSRYAMPFVRTRADAATRPAMGHPGTRSIRASSRGRRRRGGSGAGRRGGRAQSGRSRLIRSRACGLGLFSVGTFEDDVEIVNAARSAARPPRDICSIAAGVSDFASNGRAAARHLRHRAMVRRLRPTSRARACCRRLRSGISRSAGTRPDYPALQAVAGAVIATHCARLAESVERDALWAAAGALETSTLLGRFAIEPDTGCRRGTRRCSCAGATAGLQLVA